MNKHMWLAIIPICMAFLVSSGCSDEEDNGNGGNNPPPITNANVTSEWIKSFCTNLMSCQAQYGGSTFDSVADCQQDMLAEVGTSDPMTNQNLYSVDNAKARACLNKVAAAPCNGTFDEDADADCLGAVVGKLASGVCCDHRGGCAPDLFCTNTDTQTGTCQAVAQLNQSCSNAECGLGLYCDDATDLCKSYLAQNAACTPNQSEACGVLDCIGNVCKPSLLVGDTCVAGNNDHCPDFADCINSKCTAEVANVGGTCDEDEVVAPDCNILEGVFCDSDTDKCVQMAALNQDCVATDYMCHPVMDLYCNIQAGAPPTGTCQTRLAEGATCDPQQGDPNRGCLFDLYCDGATLKCKAPPHVTPPTCP